jgi:hypothetical protein
MQHTSRSITVLSVTHFHLTKVDSADRSEDVYVATGFIRHQLMYPTDENVRRQWAETPVQAGIHARIASANQTDARPLEPDASALNAAGVGAPKA